MARAPQGRSHEGWEQLLEEWEVRCRVRGSSDRCLGQDALFLVGALSDALQQATHTAELGRAARTWGAQFAAPTEALFSILQLRDLLGPVAEGALGDAELSAGTVSWVFDQVIIEVVDAASSNLRSAARIDALTGCANRRALDEELLHALASSRRSGLDMSLAVVDLDGLKAINDNHGHPAGDAALLALVETLRGALRKADTLYRTGGDEFAVLTPFTDAVGAQSLMRRAEQMDGPSFSWGVASTAMLPGTGSPAPSVRATVEGTALEEEAAMLLAAADADLYARRRSRRRQQLRARRKRRAAVVASVAASASVTSGVVLAAILDSGPAHLSAQRSAGSHETPLTGGPVSSALVFPHGSVATPTPPSSARGTSSKTGTSVHGVTGTRAGTSDRRTGVAGSPSPVSVVRISAPHATAPSVPTSPPATPNGTSGGQQAPGSEGSGSQAGAPATTLLASLGSSHANGRHVPGGPHGTPGSQGGQPASARAAKAGPPGANPGHGNAEHQSSEHGNSGHQPKGRGPTGDGPPGHKSR